MAFALSSLDVYYLVKEIRPLLHDAFVDKIYQGSKDTDTKEDVMIRMRSPKTGKQQLYLKVPQAAFLTSHRYAWPQMPSGFCMLLRKNLQNAKLVNIEQVGFDRILVLDFVKGAVKWKLVLELFSKGNIVLVNEEGKIRGVLDLQRWTDRAVRVNAEYIFPSPATNTPALSLDELKSLFEHGDKDLVKFCATGLNLGGKYAEELIARAGIDKSKTELSDDEFLTLHAAIADLFSLDDSATLCEEKADVAPFSLCSRKNYSSQEDLEESSEELSPTDVSTDIHVAEEKSGFLSFSALIESVVVTKKLALAKKDTKKTSFKFVDKWGRVIDEQTKSLKGYEISGIENTKKGEFLYEKYQEFTDLLNKINALRTSGGWSAVKDFIAEQKLPIRVDENKVSIIIETKD